MITDIVKSLITAKNIAVISHIRPDADTFGSGIALAAALKKQGKNVSLFVDDELPGKFTFIKYYETYNAINIDDFKSFDLAVACDCSDIERLGRFGPGFRKHNNTINIDHHKTNTRFAKINYVKDYASTCEMMLEILEYMKIEMDYDIALPLYCGVSTDTGNFMYSNTTERTFLSACKLIKYIKDVSPITYELYRKRSLNRTKLLGKIIGDVKIRCDGKFAILVVRQKDLKEFNLPSYETEGFVDYAINIENVLIGCCILESKEKCFKISLRSRDKDVSSICGHFGGGGHMYAAGCKIDGFYEDVYDKLLKAVSIALL